MLNFQCLIDLFLFLFLKRMKIQKRITKEFKGRHLARGGNGTTRRHKGENLNVMDMLPLF